MLRKTIAFGPKPNRGPSGVLLLGPPNSSLLCPSHPPQEDTSCFTSTFYLFYIYLVTKLSPLSKILKVLIILHFTPTM